MEAQDIMTRNVVTTTPEASVADVARTLAESHVSALPVVDAGGNLVGIVSEGDLVRRPEIAGERRPSWWLTLISDEADRARDYVKTHGQSVAEIMTRDVATIDETASVAEIARLLEERRIKRVPVLRGDKVVGIVSRADLVRALAVRPAPEKTGAVQKTDRAIQAELRQILHQQRWEGDLLNVVVEDGVVHLWGLVESDAAREALSLAARQITGVKQVEAHFAKPPTW
jgi:CBS domain-containing protein